MFARIRGWLMRRSRAERDERDAAFSTMSRAERQVAEMSIEEIQADGFVREHLGGEPGPAVGHPDDGSPA